jgi:NAD(P)-dependent dehydrogenase (short-subunit alcohol dehydrogenase family)
MKKVLITGAARGLGREFTRQYAADGWRVFACARDPGAIEAGRGVSAHALDVTDGASIAALASELEGERFDALINNAGVIGDRTPAMGGVNYEAWLDALDVNVLGPMRVAEAFARRLQGERKLVTISSRMGSIAEAAPNSVVYRSTKAAVNMVVKCLSLALAAEGAIAVALHPGWVRTDMGGAAAALAPEESVAGMRKVIAGLGRSDNGRFLNYDGSQIPW